MRLTLVGTGTAAAHPDRVQAATYLEAGAIRLLVDCGSGTLWRMAQLGLPWQEITHVVLTHFHADHTADVVALWTAWRYGQLPPRSAPITLVGPRGTRAFFDRVAAAFAPGLAEFIPGFTVVEADPHTPVDLGDGVVVECFPVPHTPESVAWSVRHGGHRVVFSGDTGPSPTLADWAAGCDLLVLECSLPAWLGIPMHLTPEDCAALLARARPGEAILNHFYPPVEAEDIEGIIARHFAGRVRRSHDGMTVEVGGTRPPPPGTP